jgi:2-dehydropantoate 2-reductase
MTRICVFGAGAIGGYIGARLAKAGEADVSLVARGPHLAAMQANGLTLKQGGEAFAVRPRLAERGEELGHQDFVIVTTKAQGLTNALDAIAPLLGPDTAILFAQNGLPWWYFYRHGGPHDGRRVDSVDPGGLIWQRLGPERAIGTVVWQAAELEAPGVVVHGYGDRMPLGEPSGQATPRVERLSKLLTTAGLKSPVKPKLRNEIWLKLWGNLSFNPVSVLTNGTLADLAADAGTARVIAQMMEEAKAVAEGLGVQFPVSVAERVAMASRVGQHRTSMLQDVDAGRPTEIDALLGAVIELAGLQNMVTPALKIVYDLARFRAQQALRRHG